MVSVKYFITSVLIIAPILLFSQESAKFLSNAEIFKMMESSVTSYEIRSVNDLKDIDRSKYGEILYPLINEHLEYPNVIRTDSTILLYSFSFDSSAWQEVLKGEEYFEKENYQEALLYYKKAISISENLYVAWLNAGDCYMMDNKLDQALEYYEKAYEINPNDYRTSFFQGTIYLRMQDYEKAVYWYTNALVLKPRHQNLINVLVSVKDRLKVKVNTQRFEPKALIRQEGDQIVIYLDMEDDPFWMGFSFAKAIWLGERTTG